MAMRNRIRHLKQSEPVCAGVLDSFTLVRASVTEHLGVFTSVYLP